VDNCNLEERAISVTNPSAAQSARAASARAFVHSLNILIKYARMYGYDHKRTEAQFETTWNELQQGLPSTGDAGFLLGVSDNKLLLDGIPLEAGNAERSFATLLTTAGLASLHFSRDVTVEDFTRLVRAFTVAGSKATDVAKQIKEALGVGKQNSTIKINEVKFVAADPLTGDVSIAAQIAAQTLGPEFKQWLNDPQKLLQLIAAAEGATSGGGGPAAPGVPMVPLGSVPNFGGSGNGGFGGPVGGSGSGGAGVGAGTGAGGVGGASGPGGGGTGAATGAAPAWTGAVVPLQEREVVQAIRILTRFGQVGQDPSIKEEELQKELKDTDPNTRFNLQQLLGSLAAKATDDQDSRRAHGYPLRSRALSERRSEGQRCAPDDGAHEPADGLAAPDSAHAGRENEQGRHSGRVARRYSRSNVLGRSARVRQEECPALT
jgi:hypothetical protein